MVASATVSVHGGWRAWGLACMGLLAWTGAGAEDGWCLLAFGLCARACALRARYSPSGGQFCLSEVCINNLVTRCGSVRCLNSDCYLLVP